MILWSWRNYLHEVAFDVIIQRFPQERLLTREWLSFRFLRSANHPLCFQNLGTFSSTSTIRNWHKGSENYFLLDRMNRCIKECVWLISSRSLRVALWQQKETERKTNVATHTFLGKIVVIRVLKQVRSLPSTMFGDDHSYCYSILI